MQSSPLTVMRRGSSSSEPSSGASSPQILRRSPGIMETSPSQSNKFDYRANSIQGHVGSYLPLFLLCIFFVETLKELSKMYKLKAQERVAVQSLRKEPPKMMIVYMQKCRGMPCMSKPVL